MVWGVAGRLAALSTMKRIAMTGRSLTRLTPGRSGIDHTHAGCVGTDEGLCYPSRLGIEAGGRSILLVENRGKEVRRLPRRPSRASKSA